jgi:broad specificity phosphatase PhoE
MSVTTILMIRHTDVHNPGDVCYGRLPRFALSNVGIEQAKTTASALADHSIARIYSSPQLRARQTAKILAETVAAPISIARGLAEMLTSAQGTPWSVIGNVSLYESRREETDETIADIFARMHRVLHTLRRRHQGHTIVCVSHADPIMILRLGHLGEELRSDRLNGPLYPQKGSITRFEFPVESDLAIVSYDDVNKLAPKPETTTGATSETTSDEEPAVAT